MKQQFFKFLMTGLALAAVALTGCNKDDDNQPEPNVDPIETKRWITVSGALMGDNPGDGNAGTMVYSVSYEDAINPDFAISVFDNGFSVRSNRTARLQASDDGNTLFNIAYTGENGGEFSRYKVNGGGNFVQEDVSVNIAQYAGTQPRWVKLFDGDKTGVAVNVANIIANNSASGADPDGGFKYYRGIATVLSLDLQDVLITDYKQYEIPLSASEELAGHTIFRLDAPVLNKNADKLIIGTWMRKYNPLTGETESEFERLGTKSVVVDYPSLENPKVITSEVAYGDCSGYRSFNSFLADDGNVYQATQRDPQGSHILKINSNNEYDNSYVFSLDQALGVTGVYVNSWRYAGDGIAYIVYSHDNSNDQGFVAKLDLHSRNAAKVSEIEYDPDLDFFQYQGFLVLGDEVFIAVTPTGKDGRLYILNSKTGTVTKGAKLVNKPGNHYIGVF